MEEGGTKINRNKGPPPQQMGPPPQMGQMGPPPQMGQMGPQIDPREAQMMMEQQMLQQQAMQQQPQGFQQPPNVNFGGGRGILKKSSFGKSSFGAAFESSTFKNALLVTVIFLLLNSKLIWKQIIQFPFMGSVEPSMIALVVNAIIAGMAFYLVSNFLMKS